MVHHILRDKRYTYICSICISKSPIRSKRDGGHNKKLDIVPSETENALAIVIYDETKSQEKDLSIYLDIPPTNFNIRGEKCEPPQVPDVKFRREMLHQKRLKAKRLCFLYDIFGS
ncbi:unnamed protein product [Cochlearia groenlandica]